MRTRHLVQSSLLVILIFGINKLTGFGKLLLMTSIFGTGPDADAYAAANQLPELFLAMLTGGALAAALIPIYSAYLIKQETREAEELAHTVFTLTLVLVGGVCLIAAAAAPWLVRVVLVPNFSPEQQATTAGLMRIILFSSALISIGSLITSLLHAHQHFLAPAWATVAIDIGQVLGIVLFWQMWGIYSAAIGSVIGAILAIGVQLPALKQRRIGLRLRLALRLRGVRELGRLMWPRVITLGVFQAVDLVFIRLASQLPDGSISAYFYATLAMVAMPKSLFGTAISHVIFPTLAEQYNSGGNAHLRATVTQEATRHVAPDPAYRAWPTGVRTVTVAFLFQRGAFDEGSTQLVYALMAILSLRLIGDASQDILSLIFYARHNTITPMWLNLGWMVINVGLSFALIGPFGILGLAWAASLASLALAVALFLLGRRGRIFRRGVAAHDALAPPTGNLGMVAAVTALQMLGLPTLLYLPIGIGGGGLVFVGIYVTLGGRELHEFVAAMRQDEIRRLIE
ncbi:MAG: murein biosynthesis integral membrane protein MurJ [Caldilineaceae bacterium]